MRRFRGLHPETSLDSIWSVASPVERALVTECCECRPENQDVDENVVEGALSRGKEATFVVLLARHCNTASMRALALAILERTIEQDEIEMEQEEESDNDDDKGEEEQRSNVDNKTSATDTNEQSAGNEQEQQGKEQQQQQQQKQSPTRDKDRNDNDGKKDKPKASRMSSFLAMGGLKILKQWFIEAITPTRIPLPTPAGGSPPPPTTTTTSTTTTTTCMYIRSCSYFLEKRHQKNNHFPLFNPKDPERPKGTLKHGTVLVAFVVRVGEHALCETARDGNQNQQTDSKPQETSR